MCQAGSGPERCRAAASSMRAGRSWIQWGSAGPAGTADLHHHPLDGPAGVTASALDFVIGTSDGLDGAARELSLQPRTSRERLRTIQSGIPRLRALAPGLETLASERILEA